VNQLSSPLLRMRPARSPGASVGDLEVAALVALARSRDARSIAIGSGRDSGSLDGVRAVADRWEAAGGEVALELSWPESAASWLRQATRFAAADAEMWIMLGPPIGWTQMTRRLLWSTPWDPARTLLAAEVSTPAVLGLVGLHNLEGIAGVTRDRQSWYVDDVQQIASPYHGRPG
jgi:hypothetical protein